MKHPRLPWIMDPKTRKQSISLTLLVITFILLIILGVLQVFDIIKVLGPFKELFYATIGLYWGRRLKIANKEYGLTDKVNNK